ncbi:MAG: carboxypeptidase-like regulatory domain-containing protein [Chitinophagaceae bacterium]|nr:carboxypeptidase-like regulatory domain-containing protein [Chitinophagaceae bacterium]
MELYKGLLLLHIAAGTVALLCGAAALMAVKGRKGHKQTGTVYNYCMYVVGVSALVMTTLKFNPFLLSISVFTLYLTFSGMRAMQYWREGRPTLTFRGKLPYILAAGTALFMILYPVALMVIARTAFVPVLSIFGGIMLVLSIKDLQVLGDETTTGKQNRIWLMQHIGKMSGSYIAAITAFLVNNVSIRPSWIIWILPTVVGTVLTTMAARKWNKRLTKPKNLKRAAIPGIMITVVFAAPTHAAQQVRGVVCNEKGQSVAYANVGIPNSPLGTMTNEYGAFVLFLPDTLQHDTIKVSCVGYSTVKETVSSLKQRKTDTITLRQTTTGLETITIVAGREKQLKRGVARKHTLMTNNFAISNRPRQNLGAAIGELMRVQGQPTRIKGVHLFIDRNNFDSVLLKVSFCNITNGLPGDCINTENILLQITESRKGWVYLDVSKFNLVTDRNFVVTAEWADHSKKGSFLSIPICMPVPGKVHYYRFGSQGAWKRYTGMATSFYLDLERVSTQPKKHAI